MRYFLIAGEPSGDLHGSNLMRGILEADPQAEFRFWGGDKMAEVGGVENLGLHYRESSFFGFAQVILNLKKILGQIKECEQQIADFQPDVVILIDYAGFNLKMAKYAKRIGIKTFFYIAPKVWAWDESRIKRIKKYVDELFIIFPFEQEYFRKHGIEAHFEGNPLVDAISAKCQNLPSRTDFICANELSDKPIVALLSGSRAGEIKANLPLMRRVAEEFMEYQFVVAGVDWLDREVYDKWLIGSDITFVEGQTYELLKHSVAAVVTSGTATLETALIGTPQVVVFRIPWYQVVLKPLFLKIPFVTLVNINLQREAVREILQSSLNPTKVVSSLKQILPGGKGREKMLADYRELSDIIGSERASSRFARRMVELLKEK
ncbi:MAG: lipid-A-disaccharide synthase [Rikenellaceae bacterium]